MVWRGRSLAPPVGQEAAIKLLALGAATPAGRTRFEREAQLLATLQHPGIADGQARHPRRFIQRGRTQKPL